MIAALAAGASLIAPENTVETMGVEAYAADARRAKYVGRNSSVLRTMDVSRSAMESNVALTDAPVFAGLVRTGKPATPMASAKISVSRIATENTAEMTAAAVNVGNVRLGKAVARNSSVSAEEAVETVAETAVGTEAEKAVVSGDLEVESSAVAPTTAKPDKPAVTPSEPGLAHALKKTSVPGGSRSKSAPTKKTVDKDKSAASPSTSESAFASRKAIALGAATTIPGRAKEEPRVGIPSMTPVAPSKTHRVVEAVPAKRVFASKIRSAATTHGTPHVCLSARLNVEAAGAEPQGEAETAASHKTAPDAEVVLVKAAYVTQTHSAATRSGTTCAWTSARSNATGAAPPTEDPPTGAKPVNFPDATDVNAKSACVPTIRFAVNSPGMKPV